MHAAIQSNIALRGCQHFKGQGAVDRPVPDLDTCALVWSHLPGQANGSRGVADGLELAWFELHRVVEL